MGKLLISEENLIRHIGIKSDSFIERIQLNGIIHYIYTKWINEVDYQYSDIYLSTIKHQ